MTVVPLCFAVRDPFCRECQSWKWDRPLGQLMGDRFGLVAALRDGDLARLSDSNLAEGTAVLTLKACVCPTCGERSPIVVKIEETKQNKKGNPEQVEVAWITYPGEALPSLEMLLKPPLPTTETAVPPPLP